MEQIDSDLYERLIDVAQKNFDINDAEEIVQETILKVLSRQAKVGFPKIHNGYIFAALRNTIIDRARKREIIIINFSSIGETGEFDPSPIDDPCRSGGNTHFSSVDEQEQQVEYEKRLREELDIIKPVLEPHGKMNYRYLVWYRVFIVVLLKRYTLHLDTNKNVKFYEDEESWLLKHDWPYTLGELCDLSRKKILSPDTLTLSILLTLVIKIVFDRDITQNDRDSWNHWWLRIRERIRDAIKNGEINEEDIPCLLAILGMTPSNFRNIS